MIQKLKLVRSRLLVLLTHSIALPVLKVIRRKKVFSYSIEQLSALPYETVGNELWQSLNENNLRLLPYYEKHDIKHVVLQYPFTDEGEVCLQFFMLANGRISFPVLITVIFGLLTMPEYYSSFKTAYRKGKLAADLQNLDWFSIIELPLCVVQEQIQNNSHFKR
jgi:Coenzyme Q (ubiquinone) biosynthesis protein Coq4